MVFLETVEDGSHVLLLQELLLLDMDGIDQIRLTVLLRDAGFRDFNHGFLAVAPEAEEEILLKSSEEDVLSLLFLAVEVEEVVDIAVDHRGKHNFIVHGVVEGLEEADLWNLVAFLYRETVVYEVHVKLLLVADGL